MIPSNIFQKFSLFLFFSSNDSPRNFKSISMRFFLEVSKNIYLGIFSQVSPAVSKGSCKYASWGLFRDSFCKFLGLLQTFIQALVHVSLQNYFQNSLQGHLYYFFQRYFQEFLHTIFVCDFLLAGISIEISQTILVEIHPRFFQELLHVFLLKYKSIPAGIPSENLAEISPEILQDTGFCRSSTRD